MTEPEYRKQHGEHNEESSTVLSNVENIFKKKFLIRGNEIYKLPKAESLFVEDCWQVPELQTIKASLNATKSKLNNYRFSDWHQHTARRNTAIDIEPYIRKAFGAEFVTQAWCKFHEILSKFPLVPRENIFAQNNKFFSLHLCEAPGAFVTCLNHWMKTNMPIVHWDWLAMTFNPYYEGNSNAKMICDDRFIIHTLNNWCFGNDATGDLMTIENLEALVDVAKTRGKVNLITADGSVNCIGNPGEQEDTVSSLHFCEFVAAMHILEAGGNLLIKIFTIFEHESICLIYFLSCVFKNITFYKPVTSKGGNSETYVICLDFKGTEFVSLYLPKLKSMYGKKSSTAMFKKSDIPQSFLEQIIACAQFFKNYQSEVIENNIAAYQSSKSQSEFEIKKISKLVAEKFFQDFPLQKLHKDLRIVAKMKLNNHKNMWVVEAPIESLNERQKKLVLEPIHRLLMFADQLQSKESDAKDFVFKPSNLHFDTFINVGKPFKRVLSSRFTTTYIAKIYALVFQVVDMESNLQLTIPSEKDITDYEHKLQELYSDAYKVLKFRYTEINNNSQTILQIKETIEALKNGEHLILLGFLLLTQFNVGVLYLLSHTFDNVEFIMDESIGCSVIFKNFKKRELILEKVKQVYKISNNAIKNEKVILSVIPVTDMYDSELYSIVAKVNNWIVKYCVDYICKIFSKRMD